MRGDVPVRHGASDISFAPTDINQQLRILRKENNI